MTEWAYVPVRVTRAVFVVTLAAAAVAALLDSDLPARPVLAGAVGAAGLWLLVRSVGIGLTVGIDEVVVDNLFRTYRIPLADLARATADGQVDLIRLRFITVWKTRCVRLHLRSGREVMAYGAAGKSLAPRAVDAIYGILPSRA